MAKAKELYDEMRVFSEEILALEKRVSAAGFSMTAKKLGEAGQIINWETADMVEPKPARVRRARP